MHVYSDTYMYTRTHAQYTHRQIYIYIYISKNIYIDQRFSRTINSSRTFTDTNLGIKQNLSSVYIIHHHVVQPARISLTLSRHFSLSFIAFGKSSGLHPASSHSCCMYVRAGRTWMYLYVNMYTHTHTHTHIRTHAYTHTHTHRIHTYIYKNFHLHIQRKSVESSCFHGKLTQMGHSDSNPIKTIFTIKITVET